MSNTSTDPSVFLIQFINTTNEVTNSFSNLTADQLNWKPSPEEWSIGQCIDHLIVVNSFYPAILEKVLNKEKRTFWEKLPFLPNFFGNMLIKYLEPKAQKKIKAPKVFEPSSSNIDKDVIKRFSLSQNKLADLIKKTTDLPLDKTIITSPVSPVVTYSLLHAYTILTTHDKRHFDQAMKVYQLTSFPKGK